MMRTAPWIGLLVVTMVGGCSGKLDQDIEAYEQGASIKPGGGGSGGSGGSAAAPAATGGKGGAAGGAAGSAAGGAGSSAGSPMMAPARPMGSADGGGWTDSGTKPSTPVGSGAKPADGGAVAEAGGGPAPSAPDAQPGGSAPVQASACPNGVDALTILVQKCGSCHGARTPTKGLDLASAGVVGRLVGVKSACNGRPFLDPLAPSSGSSYFIEKLDGAVAGCGVQMPFGAPALNRDERACLQEWADRAIARGQVGR